MKNLILFFLLGLSPILAQGQIGIGGGCIIEGELCENEDYAKLEPFNELASLRAAIEIRQDLIDFDRFIETQAKTRKWYFETRNFNPQFCSPQGLSSSDPKSLIVACQTAIEVRISKQYWLQASDRQKRELILHEIIMAYFLDKNLTTVAARSVTHLILKEKNAFELRDALYKLGMPFFEVRKEMDLFLVFTNEQKELFCQLNEKQIQQKTERFFLENITLIAAFTKNYQFIFQKSTHELMDSIHKYPIICQSTSAYSETAQTIFKSKGY